MANITKEKRDRLLTFVNKLKDENKSNDEILIALGEIENALTLKKFGLVWEEHDENVENEMLNKIPVFKEKQELEIEADAGQNYNFILEGDNLHSLYLLEKTHKGKIDVIYIDPPYNTGAKTWRYNNDYVVKDDYYKHSKWITMMDKRIRIAKKLLTPGGFFILAIDANELFNIGLLLDDIFGEHNRLGLVTVLHNPKGRNFTKWFSANSEYMLVYANDCNEAMFNEVAIDETIKATFDLQDDGDSRKYRLEPFMRSRTETLRENKPNFWYPLYVSEDLKHITRTKVEGYTEVYPIASTGKEATWINLPETFDEKNKLGWYVAKQENDNIVIYRKLYEQQIFKNVWVDKKYQSEFNGTNVLKDILGKNIFDYPKSVYLMEDILKITSKKDSIVLDFFAGSGTTGHAVMNLNNQDGGNRKFILCTNNENNICREVTYQRIKNVITGIREDGSEYSKGLPANVKYYGTEFVSKDEEYLSDRLLSYVKEMIQLEHNVKVDNENYILLLSDDEADLLEKDWNKYSTLKGIYISKNVLLTTEQNTLFNTVPIKVIPDYYFNFELKEAGEVW